MRDAGSTIEAQREDKQRAGGRGGGMQMVGQGWTYNLGANNLGADCLGAYNRSSHGFWIW